MSEVRRPDGAEIGSFKLTWEMKKAVQTVDGIETVEIEVEGYDRASELEAVLRGKGNEGTA
jgi:hypothetical protein